MINDPDKGYITSGTYLAHTN